MKRKQDTFLILYNNITGTETKVLFNIRPCLIWILKSGSWNHGVVNKENVESESGFLKTNAKAGSRFYPDVIIYQFYPYEFYQNVIALFH